MVFLFLAFLRFAFTEIFAFAGLKFEPIYDIIKLTFIKGETSYEF